MANVKAYSVKKDGNLKLSPNFAVREFRCFDGTDEILIDLELVKLLQNIRDKIGAAISINSAYRTISHNASVGGGSRSYHLYGRAADIVVSGKTSEEVAACAESTGVLGIIKYENFVHVDTRTSKYFAVYLNGNFITVSTHGDFSCSTSIISNIQSTLNTRYGANLTVDGIFGVKTKKGLVKGLQIELNKQYDAGLVVDGLWGIRTKAACPIIYGGKGNIQYIIQASLVCIAGFTSLAVDGDYGSDTSRAVQVFQRNRNLGSINGCTGPETFATLFE